ncbi:transposon Tf2-8 polyprotein [Trichonephila clavipes]|nr:transposon Tf2-8 polyprotein [Trichonephila clavipes]
MFTCLTSPVALLDIEVYEATGTVCADTGASQSLGGELMFKFLRNRGQKFSEFHLAMCLADGQQSTSLVQKATVPITVGGRTFQIDLIFCHMQKGIPFSKDVPLPVDDSHVEINSSSFPTNSIPSEIPLHSNTVDETETNDLHLREEEGQALNVEERNDLMVLLNESKDVFRLGGEPTPFVKHFINTEECESPYAAPVVLVPKSNGTVRLCIDYRKLNAITIPDKYPLPLMDVLLHDAKSTAFMSTLDLKNPVIISLYHPNGCKQLRPRCSSPTRKSPTDEQPVEYASRLLSSAEKLPTTEREALAVVWALNKFRGYIEGAEITVASTINL